MNPTMDIPAAGRDARREIDGTALEALRSIAQGLTAMLGRQESQAAEWSARLDGVEGVLARLARAMELFVAGKFAEHTWREDLRYRDLVELLDRIRPIAPRSNVELRTEHALAADSLDHAQPHGTAVDNTRAPWFVARCEEILGSPLNVLDLGCAGGGLVFDFSLRGHNAIGLEGSDYSARRQRAEWRLLGDRLRTCDVTQPFELVERQSGNPLRFDLITAWDVLEHLAEDRLPQVFANVATHLKQDGLFVGSISTRESKTAPDGSSYHRTVRPASWWRQTFRQHGFAIDDGSPFAHCDFPRGNASSPDHPVDFAESPEQGFHFVARRN